MPHNSPQETDAERRRRYDLAVTAVEFTRGDIIAAARILGYDRELMIGLLMRAKAARIPMAPCVRQALISERTADRTATR
jgi:hypothetical protein